MAAPSAHVEKIRALLLNLCLLRHQGTERVGSRRKCFGSFPRAGAADAQGVQETRGCRAGAPPGMFDKRLLGPREVQRLAPLQPGLASLILKIGFGYTHTYTKPREGNKTICLGLTTKTIGGLRRAGSKY